MTVHTFLSRSAGSVFDLCEPDKNAVKKDLTIAGDSAWSFSQSSNVENVGNSGVSLSFP